MHVPDDHSGSAQTTHSLILGLFEHGHSVDMLATLPEGGRHLAATISYRLSGRRYVPEWVDSAAGYRVQRGSQWRFAERVQRMLRKSAPHVLMLDSMRQLRNLAEAGVDVGCPIILFVHDVHFLKTPKALPFNERVICIANSPYTASIFAKHYAMEIEIIPPIVHFERYRTSREAAKYVSMISPTEAKGVDTTLQLAAALPHIPFLLIEGWPMDSRAWRNLSEQVSRLPNVELRRATGDMRTVYSQTKVLLVPSKTSVETFGRVVVEAQASGIPVFARDVGALSWVVGDGGAVFRADAPTSQWESQLQDTLADSTIYDALSRRASDNASRLEFQPIELVATFERLIAAL
jgi:glycosyltransferase involved in cell wall biosynthesis